MYKTLLIKWRASALLIKKLIVNNYLKRSGKIKSIENECPNKLEPKREFMINEIKIYDGEGVLKEKINSEKAKELYNENNRENWDLSPSQRRVWNAFKVDNPNPYIKKGLQPWIKRNYKKRLPEHKSICIICGKETMKVSQDAKYCGASCYKISRRTKAKEQYNKQKGNPND